MWSPYFLKNFTNVEICLIQGKNNLDPRKLPVAPRAFTSSRVSFHVTGFSACVHLPHELHQLWFTFFSHANYKVSNKDLKPPNSRTTKKVHVPKLWKKAAPFCRIAAWRPVCKSALLVFQLLSKSSLFPTLVSPSLDLEYACTLYYDVHNHFWHSFSDPFGSLAHLIQGMFLESPSRAKCCAGHRGSGGWGTRLVLFPPS